MGRIGQQRHTGPVLFTLGIFVVTDKVIGTPSGDPPASAPVQAAAETVSRAQATSVGVPFPSPSALDPNRSSLPVEGDPPLIALGRTLAAARQAQGVSLEALADRLHLGVSQLQALESGDRSQLPEAVFVIAHARRIADSLGISIDEELSALRSRPQNRVSRGTVVPAAAAPRSAVAPRSSLPATAGSSSQPTPSLPWRAALLGLALLGLVGLALALRPWSRLPFSSGIAAKPAPDAVTPQASSVSPPRGLPAKATLAPETSAPGAGSTAKAAIDAGGLVLRSDPASWVSVRDQSGTVVFEGLLSGEKRFPLGTGLEVLAGRPDLVRAAVQGGEARPLGTISQVEWYRFPANSSQPSRLNPPQAAAPRP